MRATYPSRQRFSLLVLGLFALFCTGPRPVVHSHEELAASSPSPSNLAQHLSEFHRGGSPDVPEGNDVHLHWIFPTCDCRQSSLEPQTGFFSFSVPGDWHEDAPVSLAAKWDEVVSPEASLDSEMTRRSGYRRHRTSVGMLPVGLSRHDVYCLLTC